MKLMIKLLINNKNCWFMKRIVCIGITFSAHANISHRLPIFILYGIKLLLYPNGEPIGIVCFPQPRRTYLSSDGVCKTKNQQECKMFFQFNRIFSLLLLKLCNKVNPEIGKHLGTKFFTLSFVYYKMFF